MSNFSFSHSVFKSLVKQSRKKPGLVRERVKERPQNPIIEIDSFSIHALGLFNFQDPSMAFYLTISSFNNPKKEAFVTDDHAFKHGCFLI